MQILGDEFLHLDFRDKLGFRVPFRVICEETGLVFHQNATPGANDFRRQKSADICAMGRDAPYFMQVRAASGPGRPKTET